MSEVPDEVQAAMSLKLMDNVRKLIREEVAAALMDPTFLGPLSMTTLAERLARSLMQNSNFISGLNSMIHNTVPAVVLRSDVANAITVEVAKRLAVTGEGIYVTPSAGGIQASAYHMTSTSNPIGPFTTTFLDTRVVGVTLSTTGNK